MNQTDVLTEEFHTVLGLLVQHGGNIRFIVHMESLQHVNFDAEIELARIDRIAMIECCTFDDDLEAWRSEASETIKRMSIEERLDDTDHLLTMDHNTY